MSLLAFFGLVPKMKNDVTKSRRSVGAAGRADGRIMGRVEGGSWRLSAKGLEGQARTVRTHVGLGKRDERTKEPDAERA